MTKPQIWVSAFLFLFILLFVLGRLTKKEETEVSFNTRSDNPAAEIFTDMTGADLFGNFGCTKCHGSDLAGTKTGPPLVNISENWGREKLIAYLRNPSSYADSERFREFRKKYPGQIMPSYGEKNIKDLGKIADYLLGL